MTRILFYFVILFISALLIYSVFLVPRPNYIQTTDIENGYYYDARLIYRGLQSATVTHPATPIFYIYSKFFIFTGDDISSAGQFFRSIYFFHAILNLLAFYIFIRYLKNNMHWAAVFFAVVLILSSPSFLTYQDYIGADALSVALGLPYLVLVHSLIADPKKRFIKILLLSILTGFIVASKFSFLLLVIPSSIALVLSVILWRDWKGLGSFLLWPILSIVFFVIFIWRVIYRLPAIINQAIIRDNLTVEGFYGILNALIQNLKYLFANRPIFSIVVSLIAIAFLTVFLRYLAAFVRREIDFSDEDKNIFPRLVFCFFAIFMILFTLVSSGNIAGNMAKGEELGITLRNISLPLLIFPFIFIATLQILKRLGIEIKKSIFIILSLLIVFLAVESLVKHVTYRNQLIETSIARMKKNEEALLRYVPAGKNFAIWSTDAKYAFGEANFHYWGNHKYAWNAFDEELVNHFSPINFFHFRTAGQFVAQKRFDTIDRNYPLPAVLEQNPFIADLYLKWKSKFPPPKETDEILTGEGLVEFPSVIMFPEMEREIFHEQDEQLFKLFEKRFGLKSKKEIVNIEGIDWTIITLSKR